ncbi:MAG: hypothetical protein RLZZ381_3747 [Cyanobacteriota bacterium]|jgi:hypothetical protein
MIFQAINRRIIIQMFTVIICSMLLISCDGESSSNTTEEISNTYDGETDTTEESSSNSSDGTTDTGNDTVNQVNCGESSSVIINGEEVCPDE